MNGPEHYAEAERLLADVPDMLANQPSTTPGAIGLAVARAQVHATLAQTAATVNGRASAALDQHDEWAAVLGTPDQT
jgi:hypothetical protein